MNYKYDKSLPLQLVETLYQDAEWTAYTIDMTRLMRGIEHSLEVITAWQEDQIIGLIRIIGDAETILYIQDILVLKKYKRQGIGRTLLNMVLEKYPHVRQIVLLTEISLESRGFYESMGFESYDKGGLVGFGLKK